MNITEGNKLKVRQFFEQVVNQGRLELIDELVAKDFIGRFGGFAGTWHGPDGVREFVSTRRSACPDLYLQIEDQIAEEDRVVTRWRATGWAPESMLAIAPGPSCAGITIIRLLAGKQVDAHTQYSGRGAPEEQAPPAAAQSAAAG